MADVVRVRLGERRLAIPTARVREVASVGNVTPVPQAPPAFFGLTQLRGNILPVIDLAGLDRIDPAGPDGLPRVPRPGAPLLVLELGPVRAGLLVDHVDGVEPDAGAAELVDVGALFERLRALTAT